MIVVVVAAAGVAVTVAVVYVHLINWRIYQSDQGQGA